MEMKRYPRLRLMYNEKAVPSQRQLPLYAVSDASQDSPEAGEQRSHRSGWKSWLKTVSFN